MIGRLILAALLVVCTSFVGARAWIAQAPAAAVGWAGGMVDQVASPMACYSLRACSTAIKNAGTQKLINIRRASDSETCDLIVSSTTGGLGNTANCSGADNGISASTFCNATTCFSPAWYDQGANGLNAVQATTSAQPQLLLTGCTGTLPCLSFNGSSQFLQTAAATPAGVQPDSYSMVAIRTGNFTSFGAVVDVGGGPAQENRFDNSTNTFLIFGGAQGSTTVSDSSWHALQTVFNGVSSLINVDGIDSGTFNVGGAAISFNDAIIIGSRSGGSLLFTGELAEAGVWNVGFTGTNKTNLCHNQFTYWGTATSC